MLQYIFGRAASGKTEEVFRRLEAMVKAGRENNILLVPEQVSFESERALLHRLGRAAAGQVEVLSFTRLCDRVGRETGGLAGRRIDDAGRALLMGQALSNLAGELQLYGRQAGTPAFVNAMLSAAAEWKQCGVTPSMLARASAELPAGTLRAKTADLSLIYAAYDALVYERYVDPLDDLTRLYDSLGEYPFFQGKAVFLDAFKGFTGQQYKLLDRILAQAETVTLSLNIEPAAGLRAAGLASPGMERQSVFANQETVVRRVTALAGERRVVLAPPVLLENTHFMSGELAALEEGMVSGAKTSYEGKTGDVRIYAAASTYDEAEWAACSIRQLVREKGYRFRDIALIVRSLELYEGVLESAMRRYDIPCFMDTRRPVNTLPLFVLVQAALEAARNFSTEQILRYLKTGLTGNTEEQISLLEDYVFIWNLTGDDWCADFTRHPDGYTDPDRKESDEAAERTRQRLETLNSIRRAVIEPLCRLHQAVFSEDAEEMARAVWRLLCDLQAAERLRSYALRLEREGEPEWADLQRQSWDILMGMLDQMAGTLGGRAITYRRFTELFRLMVSLEDAGGIPQKLDQVAVGAADRMRPGRPKAAFILGLNQGGFPAAPGKGGVLSPAERSQLIEMGLPVTDNWLADAVEENYLLYTSLTAASACLYLSYSRADNRGQRLEPSPAIRQVCRILPGCSVEAADGGLSLARLEQEVPALEQLAEHWSETSSLRLALEESLAGRKETAGRLLAMRRTADQLPAALDEAVARELFGLHIRASATRVDVYHRCRFSYFCRYGLNAKRLRPADLDVLQRGTIVHYVLEKMIGRYGADLKLTDEAARRVDVHRFVGDYIRQAMGGEEGLSPRLTYMLGRVESLLTDLLGRMAEEFAAGDFVPAACELVIGEEGEIPPLTVGLDEGDLSISGAVDRVDVWNQAGRQYIRVVDYKTGSRVFGLPDVLGGLNLQMLLYLFVLEEQGRPIPVQTGPHRAEDGPSGTGREADAREKEILPAGILYMPSKRAVGDPEDDEAAIKRKARMNGLLLDEPEVLRAMERDGRGVYIPVEYGKRDGLPKKSAPLAGRADFEALRLHIRRLLREMGNTLHKGDIAADPLDGRDSGACKYCDFRSVCGREPSRANRRVEKMTGAEALKRIREEETHGLSTDPAAENSH